MAEIEHVKGFGWHSFRRMWASKRKHLSVKDVAAAGGWTDTATLERCYQHADPHTLEEVVLVRRPHPANAAEGLISWCSI